VFATLSGRYPAPPGADADDAVLAVIDAQLAAGFEPLTDGGQCWPDPFATARDAEPGFAAAAWRTTTRLAGERPVRQALPGPFSLGRRGDARDRASRRRVTIAMAERLHEEVVGLAKAGCPLVWIDEPDAVAIGVDNDQRALFREAHELLLDGVTGIHPTLAIGGGNADTAGVETIAAAPYRSFFFDLIDGPDNWRLIARLPGDRGVICGAMESRSPAPADREVLVWAAHYAASTGGRGLERVALAPSGDLDHLAPDAAARKLAGLAKAATLATASSPEELAAGLDPRAVAGPSARLARRHRRGRTSR
jgi:methionine synthase II (cobalamin-independent)